MQYNINIIISVDVINALADKNLNNSIYLMDDSVWGSYGKGSPNLVTLCTPGQMIKWTCYAIDLQTPLAISRVDFLPTSCYLPGDNQPATGTGLQPVNPDYFEWSGVVPDYLIPNQKYFYRLQLEMGEGKNSIMHISTAAIMRNA